MIIPDDARWDFDAGILSITGDDPNSTLELAAISSNIPAVQTVEERYEWCHAWLVDYLGDRIGPPYQSNLAKVDGLNWIGWQAVTSLGEGSFLGTRCIVAGDSEDALRLSCRLTRKQGISAIVEGLESVSFGDKD